MKRIIISLVLAFGLVLGTGCSCNEEKIDLNTLVNSFKTIENATNTTRVVAVYAGEQTNLLSKNEESFVVSESVVALTEKSTRLNPDYGDPFSDAELYIVTETEAVLTMEEMKQLLPIEVPLNEGNVEEDSFSATEDGSKLTFQLSIKQSEAASALSIEQEGADNIATNVTLNATTLNDRLTFCELSYNTSGGNTVVITYQISY